MGNLYNRIEALCAKQGVSAYRLCKDIGIRGSVLSDLRTGRKQGLSSKTLTLIAEYFGVSVDYLLGKEETKKAPAENDRREVNDDDIKFALFGGGGEITDEMYEEVKRFAAYVKQREAKG